MPSPALVATLNQLCNPEPLANIMARERLERHMDKAINASVRQALVGKWGGRDEIGYMVDLRVAGCCEMYGDDTCAPDRCFTGYGWRVVQIHGYMTHWIDSSDPRLHTVQKREATLQAEYAKLCERNDTDLVKRRGYDDKTKITFEEYAAMFAEGVCSSCGNPWGNGVDRKCRMEVYWNGNCWVFCWRCNELKGELTVKEFIQQLENTITYMRRWGVRTVDAQGPEQVMRRPSGGDVPAGYNAQWSLDLPCTYEQAIHFASFRTSAAALTESTKPRPRCSQAVADGLRDATIAHAKRLRPRVIGVWVRYDKITDVEWKRLRALSLTDMGPVLGHILFDGLECEAALASHVADAQAPAGADEDWVEEDEEAEYTVDEE